MALIKGTKLISSNQAGFTLLQLLVAGAMMAVFTLQFASMQINMSKQNRALAEKIAALDLHRAVSGALMKESFCTGLFRASNLVGGATTLTVPVGSVSPANPHPIPLRQVAETGANQVVLAALGESPSTMAPGLMVKALAGIVVNIKGLSSADVVISFEKDQLVRNINDVVVPITVDISASGQVRGCSAFDLDFGIPAVIIGTSTYAAPTVVRSVSSFKYCQVIGNVTSPMVNPPGGGGCVAFAKGQGVFDLHARGFGSNVDCYYACYGAAPGALGANGCPPGMTAHPPGTFTTVATGCY